MPNSPATAHFATYHRLIRLYPKAYRDHYADQMTQTLADLLAAAPNRRARTVIWLRAYLDVISSALAQNLIAAGLLIGLLLVPFVLSITANAIATAAGHSLYHSWLWSQPLLATWVLILPALAIMAAIAAYLNFLSQRRAHSAIPAPTLRQLAPLLLVALVAFDILAILVFHDSVHCWIQNPAQLVSHLHDTWRCTQAGILGGR